MNLRSVWVSGLALLCSAAVSAQSIVIPMSLPGEDLGAMATGGAPVVSERKPWLAVTMRGADLALDAVTTSRKPDWVVEERNTTASPSPEARKIVPRTPSALAMPQTALFAFRVEGYDAAAPVVRVGVHPSSLTQPVLLHDRWSGDVTVAGKRWTVATESVRRKDGAMLSGSLSLVARTATGERVVLLPPAHGMVFERQELLWLGSLRGSAGAGGLDLLVKRTRITGQVEYVLKIADAIGFATLDPDLAHTYFESGIEEYAELASHTAQPRPRPDGKFGQAAFTISEEGWNKAVEEAEQGGLPKPLFDRQLALGADRLRFAIDYLPVAQMGKDETWSSANTSWEGPVTVKVNFRGKTQTLLLADRLDGSGFRVQVGMLDGEPAVNIAFSPHYNNQFAYYWVWDDAGKRFKRLLRSQWQGC